MDAAPLRLNAVNGVGTVLWSTWAPTRIAPASIRCCQRSASAARVPPAEAPGNAAGYVPGRLAKPGRQRTVRHDRPDSRSTSAIAARRWRAELSEPGRGARILDLRSGRCARCLGQRPLLSCERATTETRSRGNAEAAQIARRGSGRRRTSAARSRGCMRDAEMQMHAKEVSFCFCIYSVI